MAHTPKDTPGKKRRLSWIAGIWGVLVVLYFATAAARLFQNGPAESKEAEELPIYGEVPDLQLVDSSGKPFRIADLRGRVWVATLIFTHCAATCPMMVSQLSKMQETIPNPDVVLVSISVDPERDTPERLRDYAQMAGAKPGKWYFLTGEKETIDRLAENHLKLGTGQAREDYSTHEAEKAALEKEVEQAVAHLEEASPEEDGEREWVDDEETDQSETIPEGTREVEIVNPILHSDRFVLVDQKGRIRGYYDGLDPIDRALLRSDAEFLLENDGD